MRPLVRSRPFVVAASLVAAAMAAIGFLPLFDGPGYESALAAGLVVPCAAAVAGALLALAERGTPFDALGRGVAVGAWLVGLAWATTLAHGLRAGFCDVVSGSVLFALGPGVGALLAGAAGAAAGLVARRRRTAVALALAAPLLGVAVSVARFFTSPMIFAFDPFAGFFSGALYDTIVEPGAPLLTYRAGSVATLLALSVFALHLARDAGGRLRLAWIGRPGLAALGVAAAAASVAVTACGARLSHWQTAGTIAEELGGRTVGQRCDVVHARALDAAEARLFARDCDARLAEVEAWMGVAPTGRVTAFLFRDGGEKRRLMGAGDTYIAKPWRREVYLQRSGYPHPVLAHELAHVVAGSFAAAPLRVGASLGGWLPNPGLIEGIAVAAAPDDDELLPLAWSRAMLDLGLLPPLSRVFALGFLGDNSSRAYTVAGAFVGWVRARFGMEAVRRWYGGATLLEATGATLPDLDRRFRAELGAVEIPERSRAIARARFDRPSVFGRRCPHVVDARRREGDRLLGQGDVVGAEAAYRAARVLDPHEPALALALSTCDTREGRDGDARTSLERVAHDERASRSARDRAEGELADRDLRDGRYAEAEARLAALDARLLDEDARRTVDVKRRAAVDAVARPAVVALLVGAAERGPSDAVALPALYDWVAAAPGDGLPLYLLARRAIGQQAWEVADDLLARATSRRLDGERFVREAARLGATVACARGDRARADERLRAYLAAGATGEGRRAWVERFVAGCAPR